MNQKSFQRPLKKAKTESTYLPLLIGFFWKFLHIYNAQVWFSYWNFSIRFIWALLFLAFMLCSANCISDWLCLTASAEARSRLGQNYWPWYDPLGSRECPYDHFGDHKATSEAVPVFQTFSAFCCRILYVKLMQVSFFKNFYVSKTKKKLQLNSEIYKN